MKKASVSKHWSKHNLPEEIWREILSRLPVKPLLRFRCVSRSWKLLIDDPDFCRLHLNRFKNNFHETHLLVAQGRKEEQYCVAIKCSATMRTTKSLGFLNNIDVSANKVTIFPTLSHAGKWAVVCSMDGLVMLRNNDIMESPPRLLLWNPSIRRVRSIPPIEHPDIASYVDMGFGFDPLINDYKHIRLPMPNFQGPRSLDVYTVGTGLWKTIPLQGKECTNWRWTLNFEGFQQAVCFKGCLYMIAMKWNSQTRELISFDLSNEVLALTSLPQYDARFYCLEQQVTLFDGGRSLAVCQLFSYNPGDIGSLWVLEGSGIGGESCSWTHLYTFRVDPLNHMLYMKKNCEVLWGRRCVTSYNPETGEEKRLLRNERALDFIKVSRYVESLIMLN